MMERELKLVRMGLEGAGKGNSQHFSLTEEIFPTLCSEPTISTVLSESKELRNTWLDTQTPSVGSNWSHSPVGGIMVLYKLTLPGRLLSSSVSSHGVEWAGWGRACSLQ